MNNYLIEKEEELPYDIEICSDIGGRQEQQDRAYVYVGNGLVGGIVCDGMGGNERGADASKIVVEIFQQKIKEYAQKQERESITGFMIRTMQEQDERVVEALGRRRGGSTAVTVMIKENHLYWSSAGDSRLYIMRDGEMVQATRDHNYFLRLKERLKKGEIGKEEYEKEAVKGEALISYMGVDGLSVCDITQVPFELQGEDILLLTTDGLYKAFPQTMIQYILCENISLQEKADKFIRQLETLKRTKNLDNTTFILMKVNRRGMLDE